MDIMSIASVATDMKAAQFQSEVSVKVLKMTNDITEQIGSGLVEMMASMTGSGRYVDITA